MISLVDTAADAAFRLELRAWLEQHDDEVLQPTGDEQLAAVQKSEITRGQPSLRVGCGLQSVGTEIPGRDRGATQADLTGPSLGEPWCSLW